MKTCTYCGNNSFEKKTTEYLYRHGGKYLLVPNTPVLACKQCGMLYYEAEVLKEIEKQFVLIEKHQVQPDQTIPIPSKNFVSPLQF